MKKIKILIAALLLLSLCACARKTPDVVLFDPLHPSENTMVQTAPYTTESTEPYTTEPTVTFSTEPTQIPTTDIFIPIDTESEPTTQPAFTTPPEETFYAPEAEFNPTAPELSDIFVWISTKGGIKYHRWATCSGMKNPEEVTKDEAESRGFTPCKKCYK